MLAVFANAISVLLFSILGTFVGNRLSKKLQEQVMDVVALSVVFIGISSSLSSKDTIVMVLSLVFGVFIGYLIDIDNKLNKLGQKVMDKFSKNKNADNSKLIEGFVSATLIFNVGSYVILGSLSAGLLGDYTILYTKAIIDGVTALLLASSFGIGVAGSVPIIIIYEAILIAFSAYLKPFLVDAVIAEISGVGGIIIMAIGIDMLGLKKFKTANMIPAIFMPILFSAFIK